MRPPYFAIIAAAALVFALIFGVRQSVALFIGPINTATGLGIAAISLAFACAQLMWGITQPIAGAFADKYGTGRVIATGAVLVMLGTVATLVGALMLARASDDAELSKSIRKAARELVQGARG